MSSQMDKTTLAFFCLVLVLFVGQVFLNEHFEDISGSMISLSITDLLSLIGSSASASPPTYPPTTQPVVVNSGFDANAYNSLKTSIISDVRETVRDELLNGSLSGGIRGDTIISDENIDSFSAQQGADFMRYVPGKNPADYIRKDSVPCYGCSIPQ